MTVRRCRRLVDRASLGLARSPVPCNTELRTSRQREAGLCAGHLAEQTLKQRRASTRRVNPVINGKDPQTVSPVLFALEMRRRKQNVSQSELAEMIGWHQPGVSAVLRGASSAKPPTLAMVEQMAEVLGVHLEVVTGAGAPALPPDLLPFERERRERVIELMQQVSRATRELAEVMAEVKDEVGGEVPPQSRGSV